MSGELADARDLHPDHEADLLAPEHGNEALRVAVQVIEQTSVFAALLDRDKTADRRPVDECYFNRHRPVWHVRRKAAVRCRGHGADHLRLGEENQFLLIEEEGEERLVL